MVSHGLSIAALTCPAANVLFELFKSGFNFPASPIILNDLCYGKLQISGKHTYPLGFTEHPNHSNRAFEGLDHNHSIISAHFSVFAVKVDAISLGLLPHLGSHVGRRSQAFTVLAATSSLPRLLCIRLGVQHVIAAQPREYMKTIAQCLPNRPPQALVAKPAIRNNQQWRCGKIVTDAYQHLPCKFQFSLKRRNHAFDFGGSLFRVNSFLGEVKTKI